MIRGLYIHNSAGSLQVALTNLEITGAEIQGTTLAAGNGGGIEFLGASGGNSLTITDCTITGNSALGGGLFPNASGGGVYASDAAVSLSATIISSNEALAEYGSTGGNGLGGGMFCTGGSVMIGNSTISDNKAYGAADSSGEIGKAYGGGLCTMAATLSVSDSIVSGNTAAGSTGNNGGGAYGGGLYHKGYSAYLTGVTVMNNAARGGAGDAESLPAETSTGGKADGGGLAVHVPYSGGVIQITDSTVSGNSALAGQGETDGINSNAYGGVASNGGMDALTSASGTVTADGTATGCTFSSNVATGGEGFVDGPTSLTPTAPSAFGGDAFAGGVTVANLVNSTVVGNTATGGPSNVSLAGDRFADYTGKDVAGTAAGGGYGGGCLFASLPVVYSIDNSTIAGNFANGGQAYFNTASADTGPAYAVGGGVADGSVPVDMNPTDPGYGVATPTMDARYNVVLYSTIVAENFVNSYIDDATVPPTYMSGTNVICPDIFAGNSVGHVSGGTTPGQNLIGVTDTSGYDPYFPQSPVNIGRVPPTLAPNTNGDLVGPYFTNPYDPGLVPNPSAAAQPTPLLSNNGGPTQTIALEPDGNAIDNGGNAVVNLPYDQRDLPYVRTYGVTGGSSINYNTIFGQGGGTDVGAFEYLPDISGNGPNVYVSTDWTGDANGTYIPNADLSTTVAHPGVIGYNAFSSVNAAIEACEALFGAAGTVVVNGYDGTSGSGVFTENVVDNFDIPLKLQVGPVTFGSLAGNNVSTDVNLNGNNLTAGNSTGTEFDGVISGAGELVYAGSGTFTLAGANTYTGGTTISAGTLRIGNGGATGSITGTVADDATLAFDESSTVSFGYAISGSGGLTQAGTGTLILSVANGYSGGTYAEDGTLQVAADSYLGTGNVTGAAAGTLEFTGTTTTAKSFDMAGATFLVDSGKTLTLDGAVVADAYLGGSGTFSTDATAGATFIGVNNYGTIISNSSADYFHYLTNDATIDVAAGVNASGASTFANYNGFTNEGSGSLTVGAGAEINVADFVSNGTVTLVPATGSDFTLLANVGSTAITLGGGSQTFIGSAAAGATPDYVGIDLHGQDINLVDGLLKSNGLLYDSTSTTGVAVSVGYDATLKGIGTTDVGTTTSDGGHVSFSDCPGAATFNNLTFGAGGVNNELFQIDDATGVAGPSPDPTGHVNGWSLANTGNFSWTASAAQPVTINLQTLSSTTTEGNDVAGAMDNFDPTQSYSWAAIHWTGTYSGPTDVAALNAATVFNTNGFANSFNGTFSWRVDTSDNTLYLTYTPA